MAIEPGRRVSSPRPVCRDAASGSSRTRAAVTGSAKGPSAQSGAARLGAAVTPRPSRAANEVSPPSSYTNARLRGPSIRVGKGSELAAPPIGRGSTAPPSGLPSLRRERDRAVINHSRRHQGGVADPGGAAYVAAVLLPKGGNNTAPAVSVPTGRSRAVEVTRRKRVRGMCGRRRDPVCRARFLVTGRGSRSTPGALVTPAWEGRHAARRDAL